MGFYADCSIYRLLVRYLNVSDAEHGKPKRNSIVANTQQDT